MARRCGRWLGSVPLVADLGSSCLDSHLPLSVARASTAQCKCPPLICLILPSISVGDQRTDGLEAQLFVLEIIQFFQETVPELAGPSVDFELYIGTYTRRADTGKPGGGVFQVVGQGRTMLSQIPTYSLYCCSLPLGHEWDI